MSGDDLPAAVRRWHDVLACEDPEQRPGLLAALLADDVVFRSPAVHTPQDGRTLTTAYLEAARVVLGPTLRYDRQLHTGDSAVLEFTAEVAGRHVHGVDLLRWDAEERLVDFTVMVRPLRGLQALVEEMGAALSRGSTRGSTRG